MAQHSVGAIILMVGSLPSRALGMMVFIGQHLATPTRIKLTVCNRFVFFKCTNFGGTLLKTNYISFLSNHITLSVVEGSPGRVPYRLLRVERSICLFLTAQPLKPSPSGRRWHEVTDEGTDVNTLLLFLNMSLRGTH